jgi:hypothetical protein
VEKSHYHVVPFMQYSINDKIIEMENRDGREKGLG